MTFEQIKKLQYKIKENISQVIIGKENVIDYILISLFCSGHVLLEDVPGTGKTVLSKALAKSIDCNFKRIQFTPDLLPSDLTGINYYNQKQGEFCFRPGPIFTNILLADEINRATPRTQSSLLECMEEKQVTIDGDTKILNQPFFVIATQNPIETQGTFPLPEAQLDRFLMRLKLGYPTQQEEEQMLRQVGDEIPFEEINSKLNPEGINELQKQCTKLYIHPAILEYITSLANATRNHPLVSLGVSPRASKALYKTVKAWAFLNGRNYVIPDDVKEMVKPVWNHRLMLKIDGSINNVQSEDILEEILEEILGKVSVPEEKVVRL